MTRKGRIMTAAASMALAALVIGAWALAWALWWPFEAPLTVHGSVAFPPQVRSGDHVTIKTEATFRRDLVMTVTPRIEGAGGVVFLPATQQAWPAGHRVVPRVIEVPPLPPGTYTYQPLFEVRLNPLRTMLIPGAKAAFEVVP